MHTVCAGYITQCRSSIPENPEYEASYNHVDAAIAEYKHQIESLNWDWVSICYTVHADEAQFCAP